MAHESLNLRLVGLPAGHSTHHGQLDFVGLDAAEEPEPYDVGVACEIDNMGTRVHVRGHVQGHAESTCHRCLRRFARVVAADFAVTLERGVTGPASEDLVHVGENVAEYDLAPHVRESVLLEEPIRTLCSPDCRGLCAQCGADLNLGPCGCACVADPRWAPLDRLRRQP